MDWVVASAILISGYLIGSVSPARLLGRLVDPTVDVTTNEEAIEGTDETYHDTSASATLVNIKLGWQYGCLTSILDMLKAIVPMIIVRQIWPLSNYDLVVAFGVVVGHNWPIYYRFHGGRGESAIYGSILVTDPFAPLVGNLAAMVIGFAAGSVHILRWSGLLLMIPWSLWRGQPDVAIYLAAVSAVYLFALRGDFAQYWDFHRRNLFETRAAQTKFLDMGPELGAAMDRYSLPALLAKVRTDE